MLDARTTGRRGLTLVMTAVASGCVAAVAAPAAADDTPPKGESQAEAPLEFPDHKDPGVTREMLGRSPGYRAVRGGFVSIQVNVDEDGNNIVGDAANEPSIAVDPTDHDNMAIGWRQFDTINNNFRQAGVGYSSDAGQSWTFPGVLDPGVFRSDPVLESNAEGVFYYYSLKGNFFCDMYISFDGGQSWGSPIPAFGGDKQWFTIDTGPSQGRGHLYADWSTSGNPHSPNQFTWSTNDGNDWDGPITFPNPRPRWGTLTVDTDGDLYLCGWTDQGGYRVLRSTNAKTGQTPVWDFNNAVDLNGSVVVFTGGPNPGGLTGQSTIDVDRTNGVTNGDVYLLSTVDPPGSDPADVYFTRSEDGGATWSAPIRVNDDPQDPDSWQWFAVMSVAPNGRIDVVFNDTRNSQQDNISELFYTFSNDGGRTWAENVVASPPFDSWVGWPQQNKLGDYYDMVSDNGGADLAWAATFNDEQDVYYLRINACVEDLDADGDVGFGDLLQLLAEWGPCGGCPEDLDGDGEVGFNDLLQLLAAWGPCP